MKIIDIVDMIDQFGNDFVIYIADDEIIAEDTNGFVIPYDSLPEDGRPPKGLKYLLEVELVKDLLEVWRNWRLGAEPSRMEKFRAFVYYVEHDAYQPPDYS